MLHPRLLLGLGLAIAIAGVLATLLTGIGNEGIVTGVPVGLAVMLASQLGGGPRPVPQEGYTFDHAMGMLRRVSEATALVAVAISGSAAALWVLGRASAVDVLVVFTLSLLTVYAAMVTAAGIVLVTNETAEGEKDGEGLPPT